MTGRTTCRSESRKDLREFDDLAENVGDGSAAANGEEGSVGSIKNKFLGGPLRICTSDMTESLGPEIATG